MNRTVIITGATRGLGLSLAVRFLAAGDRVIGISRTRRAWKSALAASPNPGLFQLYQADVSSEPQVKKVLAHLRRKGLVPDILINNAGDGTRLARTEELSLRELERSLAQNLTSAFLMCREWIPAMRKRGRGLILNVSSMAGVRAVPKLFAYSAGKFGIMALSQCVAKENEDTGIRCLTICPGGMNTPMRAALFGKKDAARQQTPDFVADLVMQVVEDKLPMNSGSALVIRHSKIWSLEPVPAA